MTVAPHRITLADALTSSGRSEEAEGAFRCACGQVRAAPDFLDVRDRPDLFPNHNGFACRVNCFPTLERAETFAREQAALAAALSDGRLPDEKVNDCRARRDQALTKSDWIELPTNQARVGQAMTDAWTAYRADVWAWFYAARDTGLIGDFPLSPDE